MTPRISTAFRFFFGSSNTCREASLLSQPGAQLLTRMHAEVAIQPCRHVERQMQEMVTPRAGPRDNSTGSCQEAHPELVVTCAGPAGQQLDEDQSSTLLKRVTAAPSPTWTPPMLLP